MRASPTPTLVRELVVEQFRRYGVTVSRDPTETILIREGRYRGRSYRSDGMMAMWMIEIGLLQFYGADGEMLATIHLFDRPVSQKSAA